MLREAIRGLMTKSKKSMNGTAVKLRKLMPTCPMCKRETDHHRFVLIATTIIGEQEKHRVTELISHVRMHHWDALCSFKEWKADRDNAVVYAISGPHDGGVVILIRSRYELYAPDEVFVQEMVTADELAAISGLVPPSDWQPL
jgi:hypothetical protein